MSELLRKGRLASARREVVDFTSSIRDDQKLLKHVVNINKAHISMLIEEGIVKFEGAKILDALTRIEKSLKLPQDVEDVHLAVEEEVIKAVGDDIGGNMNLAKSRNDQVATAIRMNLRLELLQLTKHMLKLQEALIEASDKHLKTVIPGYTHLQAAQPTTFAHYMLAQFDSLERNLKRVQGCYSRVNACPMGAGALATTSFSINRERVASLLGFDSVLENSLDAVSTRDFLLEVLAVLSIMAVDISRFLEDLIIWSSMEFGIVELPDEFCSTSSIMPQKKNPEVLEVIRARASMTLGAFNSVATILKSLPSAYNLDLQEVTPKVWNTVEVMRSSLLMLSELIPHLKVKINLEDKLEWSFLTATELANMLVREYAIPFRTAHKIVGALVKALIGEGKSLRDTTPELLSEISKSFLRSPVKVKPQELHDAIKPSSFIESHKVTGGPSEEEVKRMLGARKDGMAFSRNWLTEKHLLIQEAQKKLDARVRSLIA